MLPLLAPGNVAEIVDARAARGRDVARSRAVDRDQDRLRRRRRLGGRGLRGPASCDPAAAARSRSSPPVLLPPSTLAAEHDLMSQRLAVAREYGSPARLNRVVFEPGRGRESALVAAGAGVRDAAPRARPPRHRRRRARGGSGSGWSSSACRGRCTQHDVRAFAAGVDELLVSRTSGRSSSASCKRPALRQLAPAAGARSSTTPTAARCSPAAAR